MIDGEGFLLVGQGGYGNGRRKKFSLVGWGRYGNGRWRRFSGGKITCL